MKTVEKKVLTKYFQPILRKAKTFEIRVDEDNIQVGDILILNEVCDTDPSHYTGNSVMVKVTYTLRDVPEYGLKEGHVLIGWNSLLL